MTRDWYYLLRPVAFSAIWENWLTTLVTFAPIVSLAWRVVFFSTTVVISNFSFRM
jgi:hypothetical protein